MVNVDGAPNGYCVHESCLDKIRAANHELQSLCGGGNGTISLKPSASRPQVNLEQRGKDYRAILTEKYYRPLVDTMAISKCSTDGWTAQQHFHAWLEILPADAVIWLGERNDSGYDGAEVHFQTRGYWQQNLASPPWCFTCPASFRAGCTSRSNENVERPLFLVVESDDLSKEETCAVFRWLQEEIGLTLHCIVDTAGKSLHGWFDVPSSLQLRHELKPFLYGLGCDPKMFTPSQPCRVPGALRDGRLQRLIYLKPDGGPVRQQRLVSDVLALEDKDPAAEPQIGVVLDQTAADPLQPLKSLLAANPDADLDAIQKALREMRGFMAGKDRLAVDCAREAAVSLLKQFTIGIKSPARLVNGALAGLDGSAEDEGGGSALPMTDPEHWPEPVDGVDLCAQIHATVKRFIVMSDSAATAYVLWLLFSHSHDAARISPILCFTSPTMRCGKTTCLELLDRLARRTLLTSNISPGAVYRAVEESGATLIMDEAETYTHDGDGIRGILNSGHTKRAAYVVRCVGEEKRARRFKTWCPKAVALIGKLAATLQDRSIQVSLERKKTTDHVERLGDLPEDALDSLRSQCFRWAQDHLEILKGTRVHRLPGLHDRAFDNWRPLLAIAEVVGGEWPERARQAAIALSGGAGEEVAGKSEILLQDIRTLYDAMKPQDGLLFSTEIVKGLVEMEGHPWADYGRGRELTVNQLAKLLRPFSITPRTGRRGEDRAKGYYRDDLEEAFTRYLPDCNRDIVTMPDSIGPNALFQTVTEINCHDPKKCQTPRLPAVVTMSRHENPSPAVCVSEMPPLPDLTAPQPPLAQENV